MELEEIDKSKPSKLTKSNKIYNAQHLVFIGVIIGLIYLYNFNYYIFHGTAEIFSCIIAGGIFMISFSTYQFTKNNFFMFLGIGYLFVLVVDVFHTVSFGDLLLSTHFVYDLDTRLWVVARGLELITFLFSFIYLYKPNTKLNGYLVFISYFAVTLFLCLDIFIFDSFLPPMRLKETGITNVKVYFEYVASLGFIICCLLLYFARKKIDKSLFILLEISLIFKVFSELAFTLYFSFTDHYNMVGHILKVISYYFAYMGIIVNGLQRPFEMIKIENDNKIKEKEKQRIYMEEVISQNELCYDWIIDNSSNGIVIVRGGKLVYANSTALSMLGAKDLYDLIDKAVTEFLFDSSIDLKAIVDDSESPNFKEITLLKVNNNETIDVEYSVNRITYRGNPAHLVLLKNLELYKEINYLRSYLSEKKAELSKSKEYNRVLTEFFSNISHDLKTPINVILSAVQLLAIKKESENYEDFSMQLNKLMKIIKQNSYRLIRLVSNLIDMSKVDSGFLKLELKNQNIVSIVEDITQSVGEYIRAKGVNIIFDTDTEEKILAVDSDKIERIILNLLSNAVKFTDKEDEIFVTIQDEDNSVKIIVRDTGIGIPEEKLRIIFERFSQVENSLTRNKDGSGIGLSLVKSMIEMHGGKISVNSQEGLGSEFIIELPVNLIEDNNECEQGQNLGTNSRIDSILIEFSDIYSIN